MNELLGSAHAFGNLNSGRAHQAVRSNGFLDTISCINSNFTDSGLFGINVSGAGSHSADLLKVAIEELDGLRQPINETELTRAKNNLKMNFMLAMESSADRLEEVARNYQSHGNMTLWKHCEAVDAVTGAQINAAATLALSGKPTMIVTGGSINLVPSMTDVQRQLK